MTDDVRATLDDLEEAILAALDPVRDAVITGTPVDALAAARGARNDLREYDSLVSPPDSLHARIIADVEDALDSLVENADVVLPSPEAMLEFNASVSNVVGTRLLVAAELEGGALEGGSGDDVYRLDVPGTDSVVERPGGGLDKGRVSFDFAIGGLSVEAVVAVGYAAVRLTGGARANALTGNDGGNVLIGGGGPNEMTGGAGDHFFVLRGRRSTIAVTDFEEGDKLVIGDRLLGIGRAGAEVRDLRARWPGNRWATGRYATTRGAGRSPSDMTGPGREGRCRPPSSAHPPGSGWTTRCCSDRPA